MSGSDSSKAGTSPFIAAPPEPQRGGGVWFAAVIFLGSFLLFQVQPVIARRILPWYGGSPAVWTTCLLFFQTGLLAGYAYAHALAAIFRERRGLQVAIHLGLLGSSLLLLPIASSADLGPAADDSSPAFAIVRLLAMTVGMPYALLAATGPLLQHWFGETYPQRSPFRLYAVSNAGSLLGLLTYPFVFEPRLTVGGQTVLWSAAYAIFALAAVGAAWLFLKAARSAARRAHAVQEPAAATGAAKVFLWIAFSACGSMLLLSLTNQMCQDVASVPFLWVIPLSLYLLTFIIAFDHAKWYRRGLFLPLAALSVGVMVFLMNRQLAPGEWPLGLQLGTYGAAVFFGCMLCHGEVARLKPDPRQLTRFYLMISLGGALGGAFVSLAAPVIFSNHWETHLAIGLLALLVSQRLLEGLKSVWRKWRREPAARKPATIALAAGGCVLWLSYLFGLAVGLQRHVRVTGNSVIASSRGFHGVLRVLEESKGTPLANRRLYHGRISHGIQMLDPENRTVATAYYGTKSGVGLALRLLPERELTPPSPIHVGVIGLGVGTLATYALPGDRFRFYEINPQVEDMARKHFTYLADCEGESTVVIGDARITLERELASGRNQQFDVLAVDAFSGDSIPIHLLTREAFRLYMKHLEPDGVLAIHISNRHLDLTDPIRNNAAAAGWEAMLIRSAAEGAGYASDWILLTMDREFSEKLRVSGRITRWDRETPRPIHWTDDYSNLLQVVK